MTKQEAIEKHRKMWNWLADNPGNDKHHYLEEFEDIEDLECNCYLCEYTSRRCYICPLEWPGGKCADSVGRGIYGEWRSALSRDDHTTAAEIARQIAQLPKKE